MNHSGGDVDKWGGYEGVGTGSLWEISVLPLNFAVNLKLLLKKSLLKTVVKNFGQNKRSLHFFFN